MGSAARDVIWGSGCGMHVIPRGDLREHVSREDCWCHPEHDEESGIVPLLIHHSADGREDFESGRRKPS